MGISRESAAVACGAPRMTDDRRRQLVTNFGGRGEHLYNYFEAAVSRHEKGIEMREKGKMEYKKQRGSERKREGICTHVVAYDSPPLRTFSCKHLVIFSINVI